MWFILNFMYSAFLKYSFNYFFMGPKLNAMNFCLIVIDSSILAS